MPTENKKSREPEDIFASTESDEPLEGDRGSEAPAGGGGGNDIEEVKAFFFEDVSQTIGAAKEYVEATVGDFAGTDREQWSVDILETMEKAEAALRELEAKYYAESPVVQNAAKEEVRMFVREVDEKAFDDFVPQFRKTGELFNEYLAVHLQQLKK